MAQPEDDNRRDEPAADTAGNYSTVWLSRREELQEMYELEKSGVNVVWQDPQDRIAIRHAIQQDMIAIIALGMNPNGKAPTGDATSSSYGTNAGGGQSSHSSGTPHLINLLDNEGEGGTVHWVEPHHRELAIEARLAVFRQAAMNDSSNIMEMEGDDWPELS